METKSFNDGGTRMTKQRSMNDFTEDEKHNIALECPGKGLR